MKKITKNTLPVNHTKNDFKCFGPVATKDGEFEGTNLADLGCFKQGEVDSNKFYFAAVTQSNTTGDWYVYFEYGRTGQSTNPQFQFIQCSSQIEAQKQYCKQLHSKNDKRGQWINHNVLGKILQPKPGKDCYLVRPQTVRNTGLPDAKNITDAQTITAPNISSNFDAKTTKLLNDLNVGSTEYTRTSIVGDAIPTQDAINKCRELLNSATKLNNQEQLEYDNPNLFSTKTGNELQQLTNLVFSLIPKKKSRKAAQQDWVLSPDNIRKWQDDLDVYETALLGQSITTNTVDYPFNLIYISQNSDKYKYISRFIKQASRNRHNIRDMKILNVWEIERGDTYKKFAANLEKIRGNGKSPLFQIERLDISQDERYNYKQAGTWQLFHGTRSVNVSGILNAGLRLPKELNNVVITGSLYGSSGIYLADDWRKSCGYCSTSNSYWARGGGAIKTRGAFMFVTDAILGNPLMVTQSKCYTLPKGYHSIYADSSVCTVLNNEFVVHPTQINIRYLIEFSV